jgi:integrase
LPNYSRHGKLVIPISDEDFSRGMETGDFKKYLHRAFVVLIFFTAIRRGEALRVTPEQFKITDDEVMFDVGVRLKHGIQTPALKIPRTARYIDDLIFAIQNTSPNVRIFPFCPKTAWNIVERAYGSYPHHFRLSRITNFFQDGWSIAQVRSWTGLTLPALSFYVGTVDINEMSKSLK